MARLPPDVQQRRTAIKGVDALFFSAGLWGLNDWEVKLLIHFEVILKSFS